MSSADIVVGLAYGDEAKGATTDALVAARGADRVVRFNGGHQAEHNVIADGRHHTFSSFGSGTFSGVPTFIGPRCTINPLAVTAERLALGKAGIHEQARTLRVHADAKVTTRLHVMMNHWRETSRGDERHGSTGTGFGETIAWEYDGNVPLRASDLGDIERVWGWFKGYIEANPVLETLNPNLGVVFDSWVRELVGHAERSLRVLSHDEFMSNLTVGHTVFEGAQGFLLDEDLGSWPHNTWSVTTPKWALELAREADIADVTKWGCIRTYATRHGAGPFPGEGIVTVPEPHNGTTEWAGAFRTGAHQASLLQWAIEKTDVDLLSVSWLDVFGHMVTDIGPASPNDFGVVGMTANGPARHQRKMA